MPAVKNFIDGNKLKCSLCEEVKEAELYFGKTTKIKNGFNSQCKKCVATGRKRENKENRYFNAIGDLKCRECKEYKHVDMFNKDSTQKYRNFKAQACKICESLRKREERLFGYEDNIEKVISSLYNGLKQRSKNSHTVTKEFIFSLYKKQNGLCALSGIKLEAKRGKGRNYYNISVDQIIPGNGYTENNIQLVCSQVNMMKGTMNLEELIYICKNIINHNKGL